MNKPWQNLDSKQLSALIDRLLVYLVQERKLKINHLAELLTVQGHKMSASTFSKMRNFSKYPNQFSPFDYRQTLEWLLVSQGLELDEHLRIVAAQAPSPASLDKLCPRYGYYFWHESQTLQTGLLTLHADHKSGEFEFFAGVEQRFKIKKLSSHLRLDFVYDGDSERFAAVALVSTLGHMPIWERAFLLGAFLSVRSDMQVGSAAFVLRNLGKISYTQAQTRLKEEFEGFETMNRYLKSRRFETSSLELRGDFDWQKLADSLVKT
jgi:hypothetical protein